ncbi:MAG: histidinol-phosphatase HisJ family protein [Candidatus Izemoplasmataceae bacterium]
MTSAKRSRKDAPPMIDQHTHTNESPDASEKATPESYAGTTMEAVTLTDHVDFDSPVELFQTTPDFDTLFQKKALLNEVKGTPRIGVGVELGWQPQIENAMKALVERHPFDLAIMSLHTGDGLDFHNGDFFRRYGRERGIERYFELVLESLETYRDFDVYGHIDYISRYVPGAPRDYDYETHKSIIDTILKRLIELDKAIEVNTSAVWKYGLEHFNPKLEVLKRYYALGGRKIMLGSDAHDPENVAEDFDKALKLLKDVGFNRICHYKERECVWTSLQ